MPRQAASAAGARVPRATESDRRTAISRLRQALVSARNTDGGWGYYSGKTSRLEPTCWALLALGTAEDSKALRESAAAWLLRCQRPQGWLVENPALPVNIAFNLLTAFTLIHHRDLVSDEGRRRLFTVGLASKGLAFPASDTMRQDNSLQGWSWVDGTFSWVEPTCWGLLALKKARAGGFVEEAMHARIAEAERLLIDRTCQPGGWNFGNASAFGQDLRPYVPTTALGLLAMQDRRQENSVVRGLAALERLWREELSATALALSLVCLDVYGRPYDEPLAQLIEHTAGALTFGNHNGIAQALFALSSVGQPHAFRF
ncbi:MAG TPA: hypothetical protein VMZ90_08465 [Vicinamibacterales bacterium]|nr:hypothetical protein [Vicinamibacterales bacterium]